MNNDISNVLDNTERSRLADVYLSFLDMNLNDIAYRYLKSAVILSALCFDDMEEVYSALEKENGVSAEQIAGSIDEAIENLPEPVEDLFNKAYCEDDMGFMPHHKTTDNIIAFLGKTFLYILETNYPLLLLKKK
ncbi:MAG: hypothetical protein J1F71_06615 [Clostridiales bacterium]|nr:hypothetical protein [Clostridiales bacterium]